MISLPALGDEIIKTSGIRLRGKVVSETSDKVKIRLSMGGSTMEMTIRTKDIHKITIDGNTRTLHERKKRKPYVRRTSSRRSATRTVRKPTIRKTAKKNASGQVVRSSSQVEALIRKAGGSRPSWWGSTPLKYPSTLDLTWQNPPRGSGWQPNKWLGQYMWTYINENPRRWTEGTRTLHHTLLVNKNNRSSLSRSMNALGTAYAELLGDWARAAFWWRKGGGGGHGYNNAVALATCYFKLGNKKMAIDALSKNTGGRYNRTTVVRLWADLGQIKRALSEAQGIGGPQGNLAAGDVLRQAGRYKEALQYYQKVVQQSNGNRGKRMRNRAQANIDGIKIYNMLDVRRIRNGTYTSNSVGYSGQVYMTVTVKRGKIVDCKVTRQKEKQYYSSLKDIPQRIKQRQGIKGVDLVTGATMTSEAIINATGKALAQGMR